MPYASPTTFEAGDLGALLTPRTYYADAVAKMNARKARERANEDSVSERWERASINWTPPTYD
jgi:hypothetical protein